MTPARPVVGRRLRGAPLLAALLAAGAPRPAPALAAGRPADDGSVVVKLDAYLGRLVTLSARVRGEKLSLLLDTGGGQTLVTPGAAARIGCTPSGRSIGFRMTGERVSFQRCDARGLELGGRVLATTGIAVWDVAAVLPKEAPPLDGVLALDALFDQPFTLQLAARTLTLESAGSLERRVGTMARVRARTATGMTGEDLTVLVRGALDEPGWFLFDTGNLDVTRAAPHMVRRREPQAERIESATLSLDGLPAQSLPVSVRDIIYDGVLSEELLRQWDWTFRLSSGELWASRAR